MNNEGLTGPELIVDLTDPAVEHDVDLLMLNPELIGAMGYARYIRTITEKNIILEEENRALRRENKALQEAAHKDYLTKTWNVRALREIIRPRIVEVQESEQESERESCRTIEVVYADIRGFKPINDAHGHDFGDKVIKAYSDYLNTSFKELSNDEYYEYYVIRKGGDEFIIITVLPNSYKGDFNKDVSSFLTSSEKSPFSMIVDNTPITCVFDYAGITLGDKVLGDAIIEADKAMLRRKEEYYASEGDRRRTRE